MSSATTSGTTTAFGATRSFSVRWLRFVLRFVRRKPMGAIGAVIIVLFVITALFAPLLAPYDPNERFATARLAAPDGAHLLGTDNLGRDILSRVIYGSQIAVRVAAGAVLVGTVFGTVLGLASGYYGGWFDLLLQRIVDIMMGFPALILAISIVSILGPGLLNVIVALSIATIPRLTRVVRGSVLAEKESAYVESARALGAGGMRIMTRHLLPNVTAPIIIIATSQLGIAIVAEASLTFLGIGVPITTPSWGGMLSGASQQYMERAPWMAIFPGLAISLTVLGFNFLGDALRDEWDPRLRGSRG